MRGESGGARGQITAFVLIGLALLFVMLIILLLRSALVAQQTPINGEQQKLVKTSVEQCLDLVTADALQKLASQGGRLYESQGGLTPDDDPWTFPVKSLNSASSAGAETIRVGFALINDSGIPFRPPTIAFFNAHSGQGEYDFDSSLENPYPWPGLTLDQLNLSETNNAGSPLHPWSWSTPNVDGPYGQLTLPGLCDPEGANSLLSNAYRCPPSQFPNPLAHRPSLQESLAKKIAAGMPNCLDVEALSAKLGAQLTAEAPNATVAFTPSETVVTLSWPLRFTNEQGAARFFTFTRRYPVRLVKLFAFAKELFSRASKDPFFRINDSGDYNKLRHQDSFSVRQEHLLPARVGGRNDLLIVTITDAKSTLRGGAYSMSFLIQNRAPVLNNLSSPALITPALSFEALDPDGDALSGSANPTTGNPPALSLTCAPSTVNKKRESCSPLPYNLGAGQYNISVSDNYGGSDWQVVSFTPPPS